MEGGGSPVASVWFPRHTGRRLSPVPPTPGQCRASQRGLPGLVPGSWGAWSQLSSTVLEEGALQEGGQLCPVILRGRRKAWRGQRGTVHPTPTQPAPPAHLVDEAIMHELSGEILGTVGCGRGVGTRCEDPPQTPTPPLPGDATQPTWEQVVSKLPVQPVLQHQKQSELGDGEARSVPRARPAPHAPPPRPCSHASAPCPRCSPGYTASGSPGGVQETRGALKGLTSATEQQEHMLPQRGPEGTVMGKFSKGTLESTSHC